MLALKVKVIISAAWCMGARLSCFFISLSVQVTVFAVDVLIMLCENFIYFVIDLNSSSSRLTSADICEGLSQRQFMYV